MKLLRNGSSVKHIRVQAETTAQSKLIMRESCMSAWYLVIAVVSLAFQIIFMETATEEQ